MTLQGAPHPGKWWHFCLHIPHINKLQFALVPGSQFWKQFPVFPFGANKFCCHDYFGVLFLLTPKRWTHWVWWRWETGWPWARKEPLWDSLLFCLIDIIPTSVSDLLSLREDHWFVAPVSPLLPAYEEQPCLDCGNQTAFPSNCPFYIQCPWSAFHWITTSSSINNPIVYSPTLSLVSHQLRNFVLNHSSVYCTCYLLRTVTHEAGLWR